MIIAFTSNGPGMDSKIDPRFGRTEYLVVYNTEKGSSVPYDNRSIASEEHGAGPKTAQKLHEMGVEVLITGNGPGGNALSVLEKTGIAIFTGAGEMTLNEAMKAYTDDRLTDFLK